MQPGTIQTKSPPIKCIGPWAGGKRRLAPKIIDLLGPHTFYFEPFVGGCSILPQKPPAQHEYISDLNRETFRVLCMLKVCGNEISAELSARTYSKQTFTDSLAQLPECDADPSRYSHLQHACDILTVWWMGPGGIAGTSRKPWFAQRHTQTGGCPRKRWESFLASIPALSARLKDVAIMRGCGLHLLEKQISDLDGVAIYCDPPYLTKSFSYARDFNYLDHCTLAVALNRFRHARVVLSYYDDGSGALDNLYPPGLWDRTEIELSKSMASSSGTAKRATEILLTNRLESR